MTIVLGIDPSYACTALVWWNPYTPTVVPHVKLHLPAGPGRLLLATKRFTHAIKINGKPDLAIIENAAYGSPNRVVVGKLKELSGVYKMVLEAMDIPYLEIAPTMVKKFVTGSGKAEKHLVASELKRRWGVVLRPL